MPLLAPCPACTRELSETATTCPQCGHVLGPGWQERVRAANEITVEPLEYKSSSKVLPATVAVLFVALVSALIYLDRHGPIQAYQSTQSPSAHDPAREQERICGYDAEALTYAQVFVKRQLSAPSSADFGSLSESQLAMTRCGTWSVKSYVDAENAFGAKLRKPFYVRMEKQGADWHLMELNLE